MQKFKERRGKILRRKPLIHKENIKLKAMPPSNFLKSITKEDSGETSNRKNSNDGQFDQKGPKVKW